MPRKGDFPQPRAEVSTPLLDRRGKTAAALWNYGRCCAQSTVRHCTIIDGGASFGTQMPDYHFVRLGDDGKLIGPAMPIRASNEAATGRGNFAAELRDAPRLVKTFVRPTQ